MDNHDYSPNYQSSSQIDWQSTGECSRANCELKELKRSIDWKQGLAIALGVPLFQSNTPIACCGDGKLPR
ncbi:MAG TPA: hypothetical protein VN414_09150 [Methanosarcina sp.]|nr:hypothetical protein [Methanosarcina sp.]